jgi:glycosyltransferase involved in cell wall biosynthesis
MVTVSTLIPVYNGEEFIAEAVDSVLDQNGVDVEIIVIDDGSTDSTPNILEGYGDRIRVLRQKNSGHVNARNNGANLAKGEWLAFLDADDMWLPDKLQKQLAIVGRSVGMVYTGRENFGDIDRVKVTAAHDLLEGNLFEPLLLGNFITLSSVIMRKNWFDRAGGFDEHYATCEDWDLWLRFSAAGSETAVVCEPLTRYRWHANAMTNNQDRMCDGRLKVLECALASERAKSLPFSIVHKSRASAWHCSAWHAMPSSRMKALWWCFRSAWQWPWDSSTYKLMVKCCLGIQ